MYTSSTMHTHKINLPKKLLLYGFGLCIGLVMMYRGFSGGTIFNEGTDNKKPETAQTSGIMQKVDNAKQSNPYAQQANNTLSLECRKAVNVEKAECVKWFNDLSKNNNSVTASGAVVQAVSYNPNKPYDFEYQPQVTPTDFPKMSGVIKLSSGKLMAVDQQGNYMQSVSQQDCQKWLNGYRPFNYFAQQKQSVERVSTSESGNQNSETSSL